MIDGIGGISYDASAGGVAIGDNTRRPRLFKITAGSNPYTASEVVLLETDGSRSNTGIYDVTAAQKVLWEVNGNTSVPVNTIVEATPNAAGLGFYFGYTEGSSPTVVSNAAYTGTFSLVVSAGTWTSVTVPPGQNFTFPSTASGTLYLITMDVRAAVGNAAISSIHARLFFDGSAITDSERLVVSSPAGVTTQVGRVMQWVFTPTTGSGSLNVQFKREGTGAWTQSDILSDSNGRTVLSCIRLK